MFLLSLRLVAFLFKVDAYMSLFQWHYPQIQREELDVTLLSTFTIRNGYGLDKFFRRFQKEPTTRREVKMSTLMSNPMLLGRGALFIEDVHLGLSGMIPQIWRDTQMRKAVGRKPDSSRTHEEEEDLTKRQLDAWKPFLEDHWTLCRKDNRHPKTETFLLAYVTEENETVPGWIAPARERALSLLLETTVLYHLLSLILAVEDVEAIMVTPQNSSADAIIHPADAHSRTRLRNWAQSAYGRRSLVHCLAILRVCEASWGEERRPRVRLQPIQRLAISLAAMCLSTYMDFNEGCSCGPDERNVRLNVDFPALGRDAGVESWVRSGGAAEFQQIPLCSCRKRAWVYRFGCVLLEDQGNAGIDGAVEEISKQIRSSFP